MSEQWVLVLDEYEAVNLAAVLRHIHDHPASQHLNTGDWVYQLLWKMPSELHHGPGQGLQSNPIELLGEGTEDSADPVAIAAQISTEDQFAEVESPLILEVVDAVLAALRGDTE